LRPLCWFESGLDLDNIPQFRVECGAKLEKLCPQCNSSNAPEFKFCGDFGYDLTTSSSTPASLVELSFEEKLENIVVSYSYCMRQTP
jgi:hypothetical protein